MQQSRVDAPSPLPAGATVPPGRRLHKSIRLDLDCETPRPHNPAGCTASTVYLARAVTELALARLRRAGFAEGSGVPVAARSALTSLAS